MTTMTTTIETSLQPILDLQGDIEAIRTFADGLVIESQQDAQMVGEVLKRIAATKKEVGAKRMEITRPLDAAKKAAINQEKETLEPLEILDRKLRQLFAEWRAEQERIAREAREAAERERREAEERARRAAEEAEREARRREQAAQERKTEAARERNRLAAEEAQRQADAERMRALTTAAATPVEAATPKAPAGVGTQTRWVAEVVDEAQVPREFLAVDMRAINYAVRQGAREIPGVEIRPETSTVVRG